MDGPTSSAGVPNLAVAQVTGQDVENHQIYIQLKSLQSPILPCRVLINGPADTYYVRQKPLPRTGTWGLVAFVQGDDRVPIWLGAFYNTLVNAYITSPPNPAPIQDSQLEFESHFSGEFTLLDGYGNHTIRLADGTLILASETGVEAPTFRHVVDSTQTQQRVQVADGERNTDPPAEPFYLKIAHPSGVTVSVDPLGNFLLTGQKGTDGAYISLDQYGNLTLNAGKAEGNDVIANFKDDGTISFANKNTTFTINPDGSFYWIQGEGGSQPQINFGQQGNVLVVGPDNQTIKLGPTGTGDTTLSITDGKGATFNTDSSGDITISSPNHITLTAGSSSIILYPYGDIVLATPIGIITLPVIGAISITSISPGTGIVLTAPPNTITANGNILG